MFASGVQNTTPSAYFSSVSCASAGNCTAAGSFRNAAGNIEAFTMTSTAGTWGQATPAVFASGVQNTTPDAYFDSVSCASAGNCTAAGSFKNAAGYREAFTMTSTAGAPIPSTTTVVASTTTSPAGAPIASTTTVVASTTTVVPVLPATGSGVNGPVVVGLLALAAGVMVRSRQRRSIN